MKQRILYNHHRNPVATVTTVDSGYEVNYFVKPKPFSDEVVAVDLYDDYKTRRGLMEEYELGQITLDDFL